MSKSDTDGRVDPTPRDPTSVRPVLDVDLTELPTLHECGNCRRTIGDAEAFRTIAPSKVRYHPGCVSSRVVGDPQDAEALSEALSNIHKWPTIKLHSPDTVEVWRQIRAQPTMPGM